MEELKLAAKKAVGTKAVLRALKAREAAYVYVASDIDTFLYQKIVRACDEAGVKIRRVESNKELGKVCALSVGCAAAAVLL
jgi:ribosomal protein L7Ae-like RNA K-turn-binding protein